MNIQVRISREICTQDLANNIWNFEAAGFQHSAFQFLDRRLAVEGGIVQVSRTSSVAVRRERNLRFLSLWIPFFPSVAETRTPVSQIPPTARI
jgi:hypothetical protein